MCLKAIILFTAFVLSNVYAATVQTLDIDKINYSIEMNSHIVESDDVKARVFGVGLGLRLEEGLSKNTNLYIDMSAVLETGSNDSVGTVAEFEPVEQVDLNAASINYNQGLLQLKGGALNLGEYKSPLLISSVPFVALSQKFGEKLYIKAIQAIPSNNKLTKRIGSVDNGNPTFIMETLGMQIGNKYKLNLEVGHFAYANLSSEVAVKSGELGNSVDGIGEAARFNYGFSGLNAYSRVELNFNKNLKLELSGQYLVNNDAPDNRNKARLLSAMVNLKSLGLGIENFESQSDASPAFYNSKYYGHNNVRGNGAKIVFNTGKSRIEIDYKRIEVLEDQFTQADTEIVQFNMVREYEI